MINSFERREPLLYLFVAEPQFFGHQYGCSEVHGIEGTQNTCRVAYAVQGKAGGIERRFNIFYEVVRCRKRAFGIHHLSGAEDFDILFGFDHRTLVDPRFFQPAALKDLHFGISDVLHRFEILDMCRTDLSDDHIVRVDEGRDLFDIPLTPCTHFDDIDLRIFGKVVVDIFHDTPKGIDRTRCGIGSVLCLEQMPDVVLDAGLSVACRDPHYGKVFHLFYLLFRLDLEAVKQHLLYEKRDEICQEDGYDHGKMAKGKGNEQGKKQHDRIEAFDTSCPYQRLVQTFVPLVEKCQIGDDHHETELRYRIAHQHIKRIGNEEIDEMPPGLGMVEDHTFKFVAVPLQIGNGVVTHGEKE